MFRITFFCYYQSDRLSRPVVRKVYRGVGSFLNRAIVRCEDDMRRQVIGKLLRTIGTSTAVLLAAADLAEAGSTINWKSTVASGNFATLGTNWNGNVVPGTADTAQFNNSGSYIISFTTNPVTTGLDVASGVVTFVASTSAHSSVGSWYDKC